MNDKKKILLIWFREYPWDVRIEKIAKSLINNGYSVRILCRWKGEAEELETINNIEIFRHGYNKSSYISAPFYKNFYWKKAVSDQINSFSPDLIIVRDMHLSEMTAKAASKKNIPVLMDMAEHYPGAMREWKKYNNSALKRFLMHNYKLPDKIEKGALKNLSGVITVCEEQVDRLKKQYRFNEDQLCVVHNTPDKNFGEKGTGIVNNNYKLFHHGYLTSEKSLDKFLKGFLKHNNKNNLTFNIAGNGDCYYDYYNEVQKSGRDTVAFSGEYNFNELSELISKIDIGVIPYQINEFNEHTIHNKIFDYFSAGKPVITSMASPLKRIVNETGAGVSVNCENPDDVAHFLENIQDYDWGKMAENALEAYRTKYNWKKDEQTLLNFIKTFI